MLDAHESALVAQYHAEGGRTLICPAHSAAGAVTLQGKVRHVAFKGGRAGRKPSLGAYDDARGAEHPDVDAREIEATRGTGQWANAGFEGVSRPIAGTRKRPRHLSPRWAIYACATADLPRYVWRGVLNHISGRVVRLGFTETFNHAA
jgi:hypothetical protein